MMIPVILVLVSLVSAIHLTGAACPTGWDSVGPGCYKFTPSSSSQDLMTYSEASSSCDVIGGKLVVFNSNDEMLDVGNSDYVSQHLISKVGSNYLVWVGCTDQTVEGTFMCEDSTQLALNSDLWRGGQPISAGSGGGSKDCAYYVPNSGGLADDTCNNQYFSLCEVESITQNPTTATPQQTTAHQDPSTQTLQQTGSQDPTTATPQQTVTQDTTTRTPQQATAREPTTRTPQQTTTQVPTTQTHQQTTAQEPTTQTPQQTTDQDSTTQTPQHTSTQDLTIQTLQQTTDQDTTTQTPQQTAVQDSSAQTPQQTTAEDPTTQTYQQTAAQDTSAQTDPKITNQVSTTQIKAQATNQVSTTQTPPKDTNQDFCATVADEEPRGTSPGDSPTAAMGVTRSCQPSKHHLKSRVFSLAKDKEGENLIGYCLTDHVMNTVPMVSLLRCTMMCKGTTGCKSFNYKGGVCELNDESKESVGSRYFVQSDGCAYYEVAGLHSVNGVTRSCQPSKHHLKSSVFSLAKSKEGRNLIGYCLTDHAMKTVQMVSLLRCTMMCKGIVGCKSFNYKGGVCELNKESKESAGSANFVQSDGCTYYGLD